MELKDALSMKKGDGENSYVKHSLYTQKVAALTMPLVDTVTQSLFKSPDLFPCQVLNIADLGCAAGPNTFLVMSTVLQSIANKTDELKLKTPEIQFYLNDLPANDFNTLFKGISVFRQQYEGQFSCFFTAVPGSFHGRLFPRHSLHLVHSCYSVHWLSKAPRIVSEEGFPLNRGNLYISKTSPSVVREAYLSHFQEDFSCFLKSRSPELVPGGLMLLILRGRESEDPFCKHSCYIMGLLSEAIAELAKQGLIKEEKLDDFNVPYYTPWQEEVREVVEKEGSFTTVYLETATIETGGKNVFPSPEVRAKAIRAFTEPMMSQQFGAEVMDKLYSKIEQMVVEDFKDGRESKKGISVVVALRKKKCML
ncbi:hypothetical protein SLEP1_g5860 [Rubroshorea leprosula]|uniref:Uncharacterized protein n=1 Tax=Rubroshorea leprosula TaxID=152421 RepID=A0AAV5HZ47_9ROSI|nr:hypothetical protein SLEP1_g5860 [Rubroshorea leprosula]